METLVNRETADGAGVAPLPDPGRGRPCRSLFLASDRKASLPHIARIDEAAAHAAAPRSHLWHDVPLAELIPHLQNPGRALPAAFSFPDQPGDAALAPPPDLIVCLDDDVLGLTGRLALLRLLRDHLPEVPLLLLVGEITPEDAVEALRAGASDLLSRRDWPSLPLLAERALRRAARLAEREAGRARIEQEREGEVRRLRFSEEKYRALFEQGPEPLAVVQSVTGTLLLANRALLALLDPALARIESQARAETQTATQHEPQTDKAPHPSQSQSLLGRHLSALFPPEAEAEADRFLLRLRDEGGAVSGRYFLRQPGGASPRPVDLRAAPIPWGTAEAVVIAFQDAALREESGAGAALAYFALDRLGGEGGGSGDGEWVFWTDAAGVLLHANRPFCEALGRPLTRLRGRHLGEIAPALGPAAWALHRAEARAYGTFQIETAFRHGGEEEEPGAGGLPPLPAEAAAHALILGGREYHCFIGRARRRDCHGGQPAA